MKAPRRFSSEQRQRILSAIVSIVVLIVTLQLWLLTSTMNAYLGGDRGIALPAAGVSLGCLVLNLGLLRYVHRVDD